MKVTYCGPLALQWKHTELHITTFRSSTSVRSRSSAHNVLLCCHDGIAAEIFALRVRVMGNSGANEASIDGIADYIGHGLKLELAT